MALGPVLLMGPWFHTSSLNNCGRVNCYCFTLSELWYPATAAPGTEPGTRAAHFDTVGAVSGSQWAREEEWRSHGDAAVGGPWATRRTWARPWSVLLARQPNLPASPRRLLGLWPGQGSLGAVVAGQLPEKRHRT